VSSVLEAALTYEMEDAERCVQKQLTILRFPVAEANLTVQYRLEGGAKAAATR
jgi:hypothetical protein